MVDEGFGDRHSYFVSLLSEIPVLGSWREGLASDALVLEGCFILASAVLQKVGLSSTNSHQLEVAIALFENMHRDAAVHGIALALQRLADGDNISWAKV